MTINTVTYSDEELLMVLHHLRNYQRLAVEKQLTSHTAREIDYWRHELSVTISAIAATEEALG